MRNKKQIIIVAILCLVAAYLLIRIAINVKKRLYFIPFDIPSDVLIGVTNNHSDYDMGYLQLDDTTYLDLLWLDDLIRNELCVYEKALDSLEIALLPNHVGDLEADRFRYVVLPDYYEISFSPHINRCHEIAPLTDYFYDSNSYYEPSITPFFDGYYARSVFFSDFCGWLAHILRKPKEYDGTYITEQGSLFNTTAELLLYTSPLLPNAALLYEKDNLYAYVLTQYPTVVCETDFSEKKVISHSETGVLYEITSPVHIKTRAGYYKWKEDKYLRVYAENKNALSSIFSQNMLLDSLISDSNRLMTENWALNAKELYSSSERERLVALCLEQTGRRPGEFH